MIFLFYWADTCMNKFGDMVTYILFKLIGTTHKKWYHLQKKNSTYGKAVKYVTFVVKDVMVKMKNWEGKRSS